MARDCPSEVRLVELLAQVQTVQGEQPVGSWRNPAKSEFALRVRAGPAEKLGRAGIGQIGYQQHRPAGGTIVAIEKASSNTPAL